MVDSVLGVRTKYFTCVFNLGCMDHEKFGCFVLSSSSSSLFCTCEVLKYYFVCACRLCLILCLFIVFVVFVAVFFYRAGDENSQNEYEGVRGAGAHVHPPAQRHFPRRA